MYFKSKYCSEPYIDNFSTACNHDLHRTVNYMIYECITVEQFNRFAKLL